ncbi:MAG: PQQ-binding-like beta-propeller repeat protein, partial [Euryarchaeota archaeon]
MRLRIKLISLTLALLFIGSIGAVAVSAQSGSSTSNDSSAGIVSAQAAIQIKTMQFRYNAAHTGDYSAVAGNTQPNNHLKWKYTTEGGVWSSPAIANGVVYVGSNDNKVYAFNAATGAKKWSYTTGNDVSSSPAVANGVVYVGSNDNKVYALNAATGAKK